MGVCHSRFKQVNIFMECLRDIRDAQEDKALSFPTAHHVCESCKKWFPCKVEKVDEGKKCLCSTVLVQCPCDFCENTAPFLGYICSVGCLNDIMLESMEPGEPFQDLDKGV